MLLRSKESLRKRWMSERANNQELPVSLPILLVEALRNPGTSTIRRYAAWTLEYSLVICPPLGSESGTAPCFFVLIVPNFSVLIAATGRDGRLNCSTGGASTSR